VASAPVPDRHRGPRSSSPSRCWSRGRPRASTTRWGASSRLRRRPLGRRRGATGPFVGAASTRMSWAGRRQPGVEAAGVILFRGTLGGVARRRQPDRLRAGRLGHRPSRKAGRRATPGSRGRRRPRDRPGRDDRPHRRGTGGRGYRRRGDVLLRHPHGVRAPGRPAGDDVRRPALVTTVITRGAPSSLPDGVVA
jgi:hypothetical protein